MSSKPWFILSTPRSGSTWCYSVLLSYLAEQNSVQGVSEFFNQDGMHIFERDGRIEAKWVWILSPHYGLLGSNREEFERRRLLIAGNPCGYLFKLFPGHVGQEGLNWIRKNYRCLAWERRNLLDQYLSYGISTYTGKWYEQDGLNIPEGYVKHTQQCLQNFKCLQENYLELKEFFQPEVVLQYEDFEPDFHPAMLFQRLQIEGNFAPRPHQVPKRQNPREKLKLFSNPDELKNEWNGIFQEGAAK